MFKRKMTPVSALRLVALLAVLALILTTMACGSKSAPTRTPPWYENPSKPQLSGAESQCEAAFSSSQSAGTPAAPVFTLIKKEYEQGKWSHGPKMEPLEASSAAEVQTLVCILESRVFVGSYTTGGSAYRRVWDVRLVRLSDGKVLGGGKFTGGAPPKNILVSPGKVGEGNGAPPILDAFNWVLSTLDSRGILYAGGNYAESSVDSVAFSADKPLLALGSEMVRLWDVSTGQEKIRTFPEKVAAVIIKPDGEERVLMPAQPTDYSGGKVHSVAFSPDGKLLASASGMTIKLWDVATGVEVRTLGGHTGDVSSVVFSPDGALLASGSLDRTVKLWNVATGKEIRVLSGHNRLVESIVFAPDGATLASGGCTKFREGDVVFLQYGSPLSRPQCVEGEVQLWQVRDGTLLHTLKGHTDLVSSVAFAPDGQTLASGSWDKTVRLWNVATERMLNTLRKHTGQVTSVAFSPDGTLLASGSWDNTVRLWQVSNGSLLRALEGRVGIVQSVAFSLDGQTLASGGDNGWVKLWDVATGK